LPALVSERTQRRRKSIPPEKRRPFKINWEKSAPEDQLRPTGIEPIGKIPWGSHICMFYDSPRDLIEAAIPYFKAGIERNECCIWAVSQPLAADQAKAALRAGLSDFDRLTERGAFEIVHSSDWYLRGERVNTETLADLWNERLDRARKMGFAGVRASANSLWLKLDVWDDFRDYEHTLEQILTGRDAIFLCSYRIDKSHAIDVLEVARAHQCLISRRNHAWAFLEAPGQDEAISELNCLNCDIERIASSVRNKLSPRQQVILGQIVKGQSSKVIARTLGVSPRTVDFHRARLLAKLGARNAADLVRIALGAD
jgi:DNA-binding CsgD family transcriptional regulator